ncbi:MAG: hypothetical protein QM767_19985 [Anaeromyxobacter sp.]
MVVVLVATLAAVPSLSRAQSGAAAAPSTPAGPQAQSDAEKARLEAEIAKELGTSPAPSAPAAPAGTAQAPAAGTTGGNPLARLLLMPDLSAIGSFAAAWDGYDVEALSPRPGPYGQEDRPTFLFQEVELGLRAVVDPYVRADVFVAFTPEGAEVEEAYATTLSLPAGLQLRAGKFFTPFGRFNQSHPHAWRFVDAPLAQHRLLAEESLSGPGVALAWLAPVPWFAELHLAAQDTQPTEEDAAELTGAARLLQYASLGEATTVGLGFSGALRAEPGGGHRDLGGADLMVKYRPIAGRGYVTLESEVYLRRFRGLAEGNGTEHGWWAEGSWRPNAWWGAGLRYEEAPAAGEGEAGTERRAGVVGSWFASEFMRLRLQVSQDWLPGGEGGVEGLLGFEFIMGAHGAHPF